MGRLLSTAAAIAAALLPSTFACASIVASTGTITSTTFNSNVGGTAYTNASSIVPNTGDIAVGSAVLSTNYVSDHEAAGGTVGVLVDNQTASNPSNAGNASLNPSETTSPTNATFDLGAGPIPWYGAFTLPASSTGAGWNITSAQVISGHQDTRVNQIYDLLVSADGVNFFSLSDGSAQTLPGSSAAATAGPGFNYSPSTSAGGAAQSTVTPTSGAVLATGVKYFEFVDLSSGNDIYREVAFYGTATPAPEPASLSLMALGAIGLLARKRVRI